jgi:hypothetical protein
MKFETQTAGQQHFLCILLEYEGRLSTASSSVGPLSCCNFHKPVLSNLYKGEDELFFDQENVLPGKWVTVEME